jgi:hypothetical protein
LKALCRKKIKTARPREIEANPINRNCFSVNKVASDIIFFQNFGNMKGNKPSMIKTNARAEIKTVSNIVPQKRWVTPPSFY